MRAAILIPCFNEAVAIGQVIADFQAALPGAAITVCDNASTDGTGEIARAAGATVLHEPRPGKGHAVRRLFAAVEADAYILVDGDGTYDAAAAPAMLALLAQGRLDMVTATRVSAGQAAYRPGHRLGNRVITGAIATLFGHGVPDMLSGYRVFSRRFVKSFPALAKGFETETEFTVHALELGMPMGSLATPYRERPAGSHSKLNTWRDGARIILTVLGLLKREKPMPFFGAIAAALAGLGLALFWPVLLEFHVSGLVPRLPTAVLSMGLVLAGLLALACGLVLETVTRGRQEAKRMAYLAQPGPGAAT